MNIITMNPHFVKGITEELVDRRFPPGEGTLQTLARRQVEETYGVDEILRGIFGYLPSVEEIIAAYLEHVPTKDDLLEIIEGYITSVVDPSDRDEQPVNALFAGLFFVEGSDQQETEIYDRVDVRWTSAIGNLQYIAEEDWLSSTAFLRRKFLEIMGV